MEIIRARSAGFCAGVTKAIELAQRAAKLSDEPLYSLGPIVHNHQVVEKLAAQGVKVVHDPAAVPSGRLLIRSHGVSPEVWEAAQTRGLTLIDATCPRVRRVQELARQLTREGYQVVVVGEAEHPEVIGIIGWSDSQAIVINGVDQLEMVPASARLAVISQTTYPEDKYFQVVRALVECCHELRAYNTTCPATRERQEAALELAGQVDLIIVVGDRDSANTRQLTNLCLRCGIPAYQVETADELDPTWFNGVKRVGLTAGASTPEWIIEEVKERMMEFSEDNAAAQEQVKTDLAPNLDPKIEEQDAEEGMDAHFQSFKDIKPGDIITGTVVQVRDDEVLVDVGGKSEGIIPLKELSVRNLASARDTVRTGEKIDVLVLRVENDEGNMLLSKRRADQARAWDWLEEAFQSKKEITGEVTQVVKGGLLVDVGARGFVPASQIERSYVANLGNYLGKTLRLRVIELDRSKNKVVLSQKAILEDEYARAQQELWENIAEGQVRRGIVRRLTNFGAFVDLGGADGLLHISEMSWTHIKHPSEVVKEGDEVEVQVLAVDKAKQRISLGLKQVTPSPWQKVEEKYAVGQIVTGRVMRLVPFGVFVQLEPGIEGLVHISQLADRRVGKPDDVVRVGEEVKVKILEIKPAEQRISLSISQAKAEAQAAEYREYLDNQPPAPMVTVQEAVGEMKSGVDQE